MMNILEKDKPILQQVTKIKVHKKFEKRNQITVDMHFLPNEYFINDKLSFTCKMTKDGQRTEELIGTNIIWKTDKDVTKKIVERKEKAARRDKFGEKQERKVIKEEVPDTESFFNIFTSKIAPDGYYDDPQDDMSNNTELEMTIQGLDDAHDAASDFFDSY